MKQYSSQRSSSLLSPRLPLPLISISLLILLVANAW